MKLSRLLLSIFVFLSAMMLSPTLVPAVSAETIRCGNGLPYTLSESDSTDISRFCADKGGSNNAVVESEHSTVGACEPKAGAIIPTWYKYLEGHPDATGRCTIDMMFPEDIGKILLAVAEILLRIGGIIAVGYVIYGGFKFMFSQGEPDKAKDARRIITNALIGLIIVLVSTGVVGFIARSLI